MLARLSERLKKHLNLAFIKDDFRKLGVNFITAGIVGIFINHFVGTKTEIMFWTSFWICGTGLVCMLIGTIEL